MSRSDLLSDLAVRITQIELDHPVRVAIDGVDAAGKTTLADELVPCIRSDNNDPNNPGIVNAARD